jgi:arsenate reductase-like glutaredoxin family protein
MTCTRTQEFLAKNKVVVGETIDAKKDTRDRQKAFALLSGVDEIVAGKGKKIARLDVKKGPPADEQLAALLLGPTGNLRAPTFKIGRTLVVGFNEEMYRQTLMDGGGS